MVRKREDENEKEAFFLLAFLFGTIIVFFKKKSNFLLLFFLFWNFFLLQIDKVSLGYRNTDLIEAQMYNAEFGTKNATVTFLNLLN